MQQGDIYRALSANQNLQPAIQSLQNIVQANRRKQAVAEIAKAKMQMDGLSATPSLNYQPDPQRRYEAAGNIANDAMWKGLDNGLNKEDLGMYGGLLGQQVDMMKPKEKKPLDLFSADPKNNVYDRLSGELFQPATPEVQKKEKPIERLLGSKPSKYGITRQYGYTGEDNKDIITKEDFERTNYDKQDGGGSGSGKDKSKLKLPTLDEKDAGEMNNFLNPPKHRYDETGFSYGELPKGEVERSRAKSFKYLKLKLLGDRPKGLNWIKNNEQSKYGFTTPEDLRLRAAEDYSKGKIDAEEAQYLNNYLQYYNQYYEQ